jgi:hypothetical protein
MPAYSTYSAFLSQATWIKKAATAFWLFWLFVLKKRKKLRKSWLQGLSSY